MDAILANAANESMTSPAICTLSPHARVLSTVLTAFVGSIISGISGGHFTALYIAIICYMATFRILIVGVWALIEALHGNSLEGGDQFHDFIGKFADFGKLFTGIRSSDHPVFRDDAEASILGWLGWLWSTALGEVFSNIRDSDNPVFDPDAAEATKPTILGWLGWLWSTVYSPVLQTLWLIENWKQAPAGVKFVRAIGVSVTALPLTFDTRARYGTAMGGKLGAWSEKVFSLFTAVSCLVLGIIASIELILGVLQYPLPPGPTVFYVISMLFWTYGSFVFVGGGGTPHDEARSVNSLRAVFAGLAMGAFAGVYTAGPAFLVLQTAQFHLEIILGPISRVNQLRCGRRRSRYFLEN